MEAGIRISWGGLVPGREAAATEVFMEAISYFGTKVANKSLSYFEPFFLGTGDHDEEAGFLVLKGPVAEVFRVIEEEEYQNLLSKSYLLVNHLKVDMLTVGDGITSVIERSAKVRADLGI